MLGSDATSLAISPYPVVVKNELCILNTEMNALGEENQL